MLFYQHYKFLCRFFCGVSATEGFAFVGLRLSHMSGKCTAFANKFPRHGLAMRIKTTYVTINCQRHISIYIYAYMTCCKTKLTTMMSRREDVALPGQATESGRFNNRRPQMVSSPFIEESVLVTWFLPCFSHVIP